MLKIAAALVALLAAPSATYAAADPADVAAAERAFAADGLALGIRGSFLKHSADDAIVLRPGPVNAHAVYGPRPDDKGGPPLVWWPLWAGVARSGDLGFTTGPATYGGEPTGYYFTIWKRQADGAWKWVFDSGVGADSSKAPGPRTPTAYLAMATAAAGSASAAMDQTKDAEARLAVAAAQNEVAAYQAVLDPDSLVQGSPAPPAHDPAAVLNELKTRPPTIRFSPLGGLASSAGDLVWTYGEAHWTADAKPQRASYARVWQKRAAGWRLVFDELIAAPDGA